MCQIGGIIMNLPPSRAEQWVNCYGSAIMQTLYSLPDGEESEAAKEGKAFHYTVAKVLKAWQTPDTAIPTLNSLRGEMTPYGIVVDEQMAQCAIDYVTSIMKYVNSTGTLRTMRVEERIDLSALLGGDQYGIPDVLIWNDETYELFISDGKYGHSVVEAFENLQLVIYALGFLEQFTGLQDQVIKVRLNVYQPRAYHPEGPSRDWSFVASDLRPLRNRILDAVAHIRNGDSTCTPGPWCYKNTCRGRHACESLQRSIYNHMDYQSDAIPSELTNDNISTEYLMLKHLESLLNARLSGIEEQAIALIRSGKPVAGLTVEQGYGRETWKKDVPTDEIILMGELLGQDLRKPVELDTPAQCRKKGIDESVIKQYSFTPKTTLKLVKDDGSKARQVFR
ncbi:exonuclease [Vibrio phage CP-T1]|uniref:exonuclease n=1 Tax=Vibrio phage CP-T1 TaxID=10689 RepID=UPI0002536C97|nr:exonuclease [Vibrio phage CP-T1]AFC22389.1 hypothetical protein CP-T1_0007 [Vibrio phage CP-T1]